MQQFLLLVSLSAYVSHDLLTLFPNHSSPSVTPMCLAICQDMCLGGSCSSLLSGESHPALPTQSMATSHSSLTSAVKLNTFVQLKSTPFFMLTFLVQYSVNFFLVKPTAKWTDPKALAVMITSSDSESTRHNVGTPNLGRWLQGTAGAVQEFIFCLEPKALVTLYIHI